MENARWLIAFLGDSVTHGCFETAPGGGATYDFEAVYHNRLRLMLSEKEPTRPVSVVNAGVNGDSAAGGLARLDRDVLRFRPDLCVVNFGLNDVNGDYDRYVKSMDGIFSRLQAEGIPAVFLTCNMLNTYYNAAITAPRYYEYAHKTAEMQLSGRLERYLDGAKEAAYRRGARLCDCHEKWLAMYRAGLDTTVMLANGINHPVRELHGLFAGYLAKLLEGGLWTVRRP